MLEQSNFAFQAFIAAAAQIMQPKFAIIGLLNNDNRTFETRKVKLTQFGDNSRFDNISQICKAFKTCFQKVLINSNVIT